MNFTIEELKLIRSCITEAIYSVSQWNFGDEYDVDTVPYEELRDKVDKLLEG